MELTIGIQNKETTEAGTLIITMNPVNTARWISTPELIQAEIAVQPYGVISVPEYEDLGSTELMCYVTLNYVTYGAGLADLIAGSIGDEITFTATGTGGSSGSNDAEITKWLEGSTFSLYDSSASFIASSLFCGFTKLNGIECTEVTNIYKSAFYWCSNLRAVISPKLQSISEGAFTNCSLLSSIDLDNVISISGSAFQGCSELISANIPLVTSIYSFVFSGCIKLQNITATSCIKIDSNAFTRCAAIQLIDLPLCSSISNNAFSNCTSLETVYIGSLSNKSLYLGRSVFANCAKLQSVYILNTSTSVGTLANADAFLNTPISDSSITGTFGSIFVPASKVDAFKASTNWSLYADRIAAAPENADS